MPTRKLVLALLLASVTCGLWTQTHRARAEDNGPLPALVIVVDDDPAAITQVQQFVAAYDGRVAHLFPHRALIVHADDGTLRQLSSLPGVADVFTSTADPLAMMRYGGDAGVFVRAWNGLIAPHSGPLGEDVVNETDLDWLQDAFTAPDLPARGARDAAAEASITPGYYETSEYMAGSVAVGIVLVESDGRVDPSTEDWTGEEKQTVLSEIVSALDWWAEREPRANLRFVYDDHFSNPLLTGVEPITRPYHDQRHWIADTMGALGYTASSYFTRVRDYNNDLRETYQTDWAFTIFVVDSSTDADNRFSDGYFAYAYLGGPFMVMTYGNNGYGPHNMDAVTAHEIGHIFHALDQYSSAQQACTSRSGYLGIENQNSQYGDCIHDVSSIMRGGVYPYRVGALDPCAAGQVGWRDSDGDTILDPLDTELPVSIANISAADDAITVTGTATIIPYPSPLGPSITINALTGVRYRFDSGQWQDAVPIDGAFDGTHEGYHLHTTLAPGLHTLQVAAVDSAGNTSAAYATETVAILDPVDGGLNTELYLSSGGMADDADPQVSGAAYHLEGGTIAAVQYRVDGGPWLPTAALDGAFDSDYEEFVLPVGPLEAGTHVIEARAIDGAGKAELNFAGQEITVTSQRRAYLPIVVGGT